MKKRLLVICIFCSLDLLAQENSCPDFLQGSWNLLEWTAQIENSSETVLPYGPGPSGFLQYYPNGTMVLSLTQAVRTEQEIEKGEGFFTYFANYSVDCAKNEVSHIVMTCSQPEWIGNTQLRYFDVRQDTLILSTPPLLNRTTEEKEAIHTLIWQKLAGTE